MRTNSYRTHPLAIPSALAAVFGLLGQSSVVAHHSANALYEMDSDFEIAGEVTEVRWRNPHVRVVVQVTEDGATRDWELEGPPSTAMRGIPGDEVVKVGDSVRAAGRPGRGGRSLIFASNLLLEDGREIVFRGAPRWSDNIIGESDMSPTTPERGALREDASSGIFGVWFAKPGFDDDEEAGVWGGDIELTAAGAAVRDRYDPSTEDNPFISCTRGIPEIMTGFGPVEFTEQDYGVRLRFGEFDIVRPIMMGRDAEANRPPGSEGGTHGDVGYSVGHWEGGGTLVVRTTGMRYPYYDQTGLPQSPDAEIVERWTLAEQGNVLRYELTVNDPATFVRPAVQTKTWYWAPDRQIVPYNCDSTQAVRQAANR